MTWQPPDGRLSLAREHLQASCRRCSIYGCKKVSYLPTSRHCESIFLSLWKLAVDKRAFSSSQTSNKRQALRLSYYLSSFFAQEQGDKRHHSSRYSKRKYLSTGHHEGRSMGWSKGKPLTKSAEEWSVTTNKFLSRNYTRSSLTTSRSRNQERTSFSSGFTRRRSAIQTSVTTSVQKRR